AGGTEEERDNETWVPLFNAYPYGPLPDETGKPVFAKLVDLVEVETDREVRTLIQPVLTAMDLHSPDKSKRRAAALSVGESGDPEQAALLRASLDTEKDKSVRHLLREALARLELNSPDAAVRAAAAAKLGEIHSVNVLP
ncbi:HEAT repeat domain-containing protein, partial [Bradyrhizobium sp. NBAIM08]|uniref:HEAT repeat domain-containing protein n=1 Tax=Bradyrhizobium sp. NBAIM08 TaxID=2793815 RepID=UPI001CD4B334